MRVTLEVCFLPNSSSNTTVSPTLICISSVIVFLLMLYCTCECVSIGATSHQVLAGAHWLRCRLDGLPFICILILNCPGLFSYCFDALDIGSCNPLMPIIVKLL